MNAQQLRVNALRNHMLVELDENLAHIERIADAKPPRRKHASDPIDTEDAKLTRCCLSFVAGILRERRAAVAELEDAPEGFDESV